MKSWASVKNPHSTGRPNKHLYLIGFYLNAMAIDLTTNIEPSAHIGSAFGPLLYAKTHYDN